MSESKEREANPLHILVITFFNSNTAIKLYFSDAGRASAARELARSTARDAVTITDDFGTTSSISPVAVQGATTMDAAAQLRGEVEHQLCQARAQNRLQTEMRRIMPGQPLMPMGPGGNGAFPLRMP